MTSKRSPHDAEVQTTRSIEHDNDIEITQMSSPTQEMTATPLQTEDNSTEEPDTRQQRKHLLFRLYISHFLSTWNARLFEFGAVLFLAAIYPNTLRPLSIYALVRSAAAVCFSQAVGEWIDHGDRLVVMRFSIIGQRLSVALSCAIFLVLYTQIARLSPAVDSLLFALVVILSCIEKLCFIMNTVSLERDWIVVITDGQESRRRTLNARIRRIDLICKTVAPLVIALIDGLSTIASISTACGLTILSVGIEYFCIAQVYRLCPALRREGHNNATTAGCTESRQRHPMKLMLVSAMAKLAPINAIPAYFTHSAFMPSFSLSLLYLTVLSFSGQMITFLKAMGYSSTAVGVARTIATILELSATWLAPFLMTRIGATRTALWSIYWQMVCLATAVAWYFRYSEDHPAGQESEIIRAVTGLSIAVALSRIGLWGFDLAAQFIIQEEVCSDNRGAFSATEASFQNLFELVSFALTIAFPRPEEFQWPMVVSVGAVFLAGGLYTGYLRRKRGHLLHAPVCCKGDGR